jgi:hypothetical protein
MYGTLQLQGDEVACPTSAGTASGFTDNNPDETLTMRFSNYGAADATIHYLNSAGVQIGMMTLRAGADIMLHKRRTYHKFYASSADVKAVPVLVMR